MRHRYARVLADHAPFRQAVEIGGLRKAYAFEELVAEIGNCMLCAQLGLEPEFDQSAAYVEGRLKALKEDSRAIFRAASEAQKAVDYIMARAAQVDRMAAE